MYKIFIQGFYLLVQNTDTNEEWEGFAKDVMIHRDLSTSTSWRFHGLNGVPTSLLIPENEMVDENGDAFSDFNTWRTTNTGNFNTASGGSEADKTSQVIINEVISPSYDTSRFQITNGTMSIVDGKLEVVCSQSTTSGNLTNGVKNAAITVLNINPTVRKHTAILNHEIDITYTIKTTSANRQYVGVGIKGTGEKTPQNGGIMHSHSSTLADNAWIVNDQENARVAVGQVLGVGTKVRIVTNARNNFFDAKIYVNDVLVKVNKYSGLCENDLQGRFGLFCIFGWGCTFAVESYKVTDLDYKTYDIAILGDSIVQNWGVHSYSGRANWANKLKDKSNKAIKMFAKSSMTITDALSNIDEVLAGSPTSIIFSLGTNSILLNKTAVQVQADFTALMAAYDAAGFTGTRYICTMPPIIGNATQNTRVNDVNLAWIAAYTSLANYKVINNHAQLISTGTTFDPLKANDNYHPNIYGHEAEFANIQTNNTELF